jgi:hypothetical protein
VVAKYVVSRSHPKAEQLDVVSMPDGSTRYLIVFTDWDGVSQSVDVTEFLYANASGQAHGTDEYVLSLLLPGSNWAEHEGVEVS